MTGLYASGTSTVKSSAVSLVIIMEDLGASFLVVLVAGCYRNISFVKWLQWGHLRYSNMLPQ
jgi:hypothetical protein